MQDLLEYIVKNLVSKPDNVNLEEVSEDNIVTFKLTVAPEDMGLIIGKSGQTIRAIRKLLVARALAEDSNITVRLDLQEVQ